MNGTIVDVHQAACWTRRQIMWERALDASDAAGQPVEWTGDRPDGIDGSVPRARR